MSIRHWRPWWRPDPEVKAFVADLNGVAYSSYTNQRLWIRTGNTLLAAFIWALLTDNVDRLVAALPFIGIWLGGVGTKSGITALSRYGKSKTSTKFVEAQERGKASAAAGVTVHAQDESKVAVTTKPAAAPRFPLVASTEPDARRDDERGDPDPRG
jgi:hypothetical protein